jgi:hypothetical protein
MPMNAELEHFVRESLARGLPRAAIREQLQRAGWRPEEVESALGAFAEADFPVPVPRRRPYLSAREAFLYLVLFVTLYIAAIHTGGVLFALLDRWLPDAAQGGAPPRSSTSNLRDAVAALLIAFPIFLFVSAFIGRTLAREPEKRGSKVRKWLTYITLFGAALVIISDLTFLVQRLLSGELPPRVLLKTLVVFLISGTVFGHYLSDLRGEEREGEVRPARPAPLARAAAAFVLVVIVAGLAFSGSPRHERQRVLDGQRVADLEAITTALEERVVEDGRLPGRLGDLQGPSPRGLRSLRDPVTHRPYEYRQLDSLSYEVCATFDTVDSLSGPDAWSPPSEFWRHGAGRACFTVHVPPSRLRAGSPAPPPPGARGPRGAPGRR